MERLLLSEAIEATCSAERLFRVLAKRTNRPAYKAMSFILDALGEQQRWYQLSGPKDLNRSIPVLVDLAKTLKNG